MKKLIASCRLMNWELTAGIALLSLLVVGTGCPKRQFDPTPYRRSAERVRAANELLAAEQTERAARLIDYVETQVDELQQLSATLFINKAYDRLILGQDVVTPEEQDSYFPIDANRTHARKKYNQAIKDVVESEYVFQVQVANTPTTKNLIQVRLEKLSLTDWAVNLHPAQERLYRQGIKELEKQILQFPAFTELGGQLEAVKLSILQQRDFVIELGDAHTKLEEDLISGLQAAASAIQNNAWLIRIGNTAIGALVRQSEQVPADPAETEEDGDE